MDRSGTYDMFDGEEKVGRIDVSVLSSFQASSYPGCPTSWNGKPVLEIDGFGVFGSDDGGHGRGYGRSGLQECYKLAQEVSEGRMVVHATWGAGPFYEHCGFRGEHTGAEGIKYFEPTSEALHSLFPKGRETTTHFSIKKKPREDFQFNFEDVSMEQPESQSHSDQKEQISSLLRKFRHGGNGGM